MDRDTADWGRVMPRESKIHFAEDHGSIYRSRCGTDGRLNHNASTVTCRICWWHILADVAPWARGFLDELRKTGLDKALLTGVVSPAGYIGELARGGQLDTVRVPRTSAEPVNGKEKGLGNGFARAFNQQPSSEKAIRELFSSLAASVAAIEPVMDNSGAPADAVRVQEGDVAEQPGDTGEISDEAFWNY
jgi:hypothetical protein